MARALDLHSRGRRFDSDILHRVLLMVPKRDVKKPRGSKENRNDDRLLLGNGPVTGKVTDGSAHIGPRVRSP